MSKAPDEPEPDDGGDLPKPPDRPYHGPMMRPPERDELERREAERRPGERESGDRESRGREREERERPSDRGR